LRKNFELTEIRELLILDLVLGIREEQPLIGVRKLHYMLVQPFADHHIKMGRDKLFTLLKRHNLLQKRKNNGAITTYSYHRFKKYKNLLSDLVVVRAENLWVCDITYIRLSSGFCYLSLITDGYSRKIVGYHLGKTLSTGDCLVALKMAISSRQSLDRKLVHHSDRGIQYCSDHYVNTLVEHHITISMTQSGDPRENAIAERVNGILKHEFLLHQTFATYEQALVSIHKAIDTYNYRRPHASCDYLTPSMAHRAQGMLKKRWKSYPYKKRVVEENDLN